MKIKIVFAVIGLAALLPAVCSRAQETTITSPVAGYTLGQTNPPAAGAGNLGTFLNNSLSVLNTNVTPYNGTNGIEISTGFDYDSALASIDQAVEFNYWRTIQPSLAIGPDVELDSLGTGGQSLDSIEAAVDVRYSYYNLSGAAGLGYKHLFDTQNQAAASTPDSAELAIRLEYFLSQHIGAFFKNALDFGFSGNQKSDVRIVAGAQVLF